MKMKWIGAALILIMMVASPLLADSVYFWTDENGIRHYSNTGIPPGVQQADERPEEISASPPPNEENSTATDKENPSANEPEGQPGEESPAGGEKEQMDPQLAARVEKERQRLEAEIKRIKGLSIGKSFTPGMKDAMIKPLEEQLALLKADPERYFRMKREGAFDNASGSGSPGASGPIGGTLESREGLSAGSRSSNEEAASPEEDAKAQPTEQAPSETEKSSGARSSGPGASLTLPEE